MSKLHRKPRWNELFGEGSGSGRDSDPRKPNKDGEGTPSDSSEDDAIDPVTQLTVAQIAEILFLQPSDHPGMQLVTAPLTGNNFLNWSKSVRRALAARSKLEFLDGSFPEPDLSVRYYKKMVES